MNRLDELDRVLAEIERRLTFPPVVTRPLLAQARAQVMALRAAQGPTLRQRVAELRTQGLGVRAIARRLGVNPGSVHRVLGTATRGTANG